MLNQVILVGKVDNVGVHSLVLAVERNEKSPLTGEYDIDYIRIRIPDSLQKSVDEFVKVGSSIGVKASVSSDGNQFMELWAEKLTFLNAGGSND